MEKEMKIIPPEGYEIDEENSTFECIKFKPIKKDLTYKDVYNNIFNAFHYFVNSDGKIESISLLKFPTPIYRAYLRV